MRRQGFAGRDSFDLHCASLRAAIAARDGNSPPAADDGDDGDGDGDGCGGNCKTGTVKNGTVKNGVVAAVADVAGGELNLVGREEFDAHLQILKNAEMRLAAEKTTVPVSPKTKTKAKAKTVARDDNDGKNRPRRRRKKKEEEKE